jgi:hypothetical protein
LLGKLKSYASHFECDAHEPAWSRDRIWNCPKIA